MPGGGAVVAANRADKTVYYYAEGMMAPIGSFLNSSREPLAVRIVDRSIKETAPGFYSAEVEFSRPGT